MVWTRVDFHPWIRDIRELLVSGGSVFSISRVEQIERMLQLLLLSVLMGQHWNQPSYSRVPISWQNGEIIISQEPCKWYLIWTLELVADVITLRICYSPNGWTDGELAAQYIVHDFNAQTCDKANGEAWVLLMDGHSSHHTLELLQFSCENNIIVLGYPPHCTHALQGLDVVCFAKMK